MQSAATRTYSAKRDEDLHSKKAVREQENLICVGGLRTPWRSLGKVDNAAATGSRISGVIQNFIAEHPSLLQAADGDPSFCGSDPVLVEELRGRLAKELNATSTAPGISGL